MKRALVNNCGLFYTGYNAGVNAELCRLLGPQYFDAHFSSSGSIFGSLFYAANQPDTMLKIWRDYVCEGQLVHIAKPLRGRKALDLDYLIGLFESETGWLDKEAMVDSGVKINCAMTDYHTGELVVGEVNGENVWNYARATCAVPYLYGPVWTDHGLMIDGGLAEAFPVLQALEAGYDEVVAVYNKCPNYMISKPETLAAELTAWLLPEPLALLLEEFEIRRQVMEQKLFADPRVKLIRPAKPLPVRSMLDGNKTRLNATIDRGIEDARKFVHRLP